MSASIKDLLCALLLIFHLLVSTAPAAAALRQEDCSPKSCGKLSIRYPFWLNGQHPSDCGYPSFNVTCNGSSETVSLGLFDHSYSVKNIFYENQSLLLSATEFVDDPCRLPYYNLTYDDYPLSISASNKQIIFFLNCTTPLPAEYKEVTCARYGHPAFYGGEYDASSDQPSFAGTDGCVPAVVPVVGYSNTSRDANYTVPLNDGWLMNWIVQDCSDCSKSGGACGYESSTASLICVCSDRIHRGSCSKCSILDLFPIIRGDVPLLLPVKNLLEKRNVRLSLYITPSYFSRSN